MRISSGAHQPLAFAAHQNQAPLEVPIDQSSDELHTVHFGHAEVEQDQIRQAFALIHAFERVMAVLAHGHEAEAEMGEHLGMQLEHQKLVVKNKNADRRVFGHQFSDVTGTVRESPRWKAARGIVGGLGFH